MNEELLQYLWNFKKFRSFDFVSTDGQAIEILDFGTWNKNAGPDFLMAKIRIDGIVLVGNIEIHTRASDWFFHNHTNNPDFGNLILHAVFINDCAIPELNQKQIPTIELQHYIDQQSLINYQSLCKDHFFVPCEDLFNVQHLPLLFEEEVLLKKLDAKSEDFEQLLQKQKNSYEAVLFQSLAHTFGLKVNADCFLQLAERIDFSIIQKIKQYRVQLEALFFGFCGFLVQPNDEMMTVWKREFDFLKKKFDLPDVIIRPKFSKLRPPNFPTIRLSQLAGLYHSQPNLFSKLIDVKSIKEMHQLFEAVSVSEYWENRYNFNTISPIKSKKFLSRDFIDLIIINTILPLKYFYHKNHNPEIVEDVLELYKQMKPEKNTILEGWEKLGVRFASILQTQAFLYHYKTMCSHKKCLNCSIGFRLMDHNE